MTFECTIPAEPTVQQDDGTARITRWDFAPGAATGWHRHGWPYFVVMLTDGTLKLHNGSTVTEVSLVAGQSYMRAAGVEHDVIPYGTVLGDRAFLNGLNIIGMKRRGVARDEIQALRTAYRLLFAPEGGFAERLAEVAEQFGAHPRVMEIVDFIRSADSRAICMPRQNRIG